MARSSSTLRQSVTRAHHTAAPEKTVRRRKPTLRAALVAAQKAGKAVKSATIEDGKVTLVFGELAADANDDWDRKLAELERGKH